MYACFPIVLHYVIRYVPTHRKFKFSALHSCKCMQKTPVAPATADITYNVLLWSKIKKSPEFQLTHSQVIMQSYAVFPIVAGRYSTCEGISYVGGRRQNCTTCCLYFRMSGHSYLHSSDLSHACYMSTEILNECTGSSWKACDRLKKFNQNILICLQQ